MSQNTQQYPTVGTDLQPLPDTQHVDPLAQVDTLKVVTCPICRATYVPSGEQPPQGSSNLLETAFLGVCRFCFRCQRPACPQCWNPVHHTCASCSEEARLPFRAPVPSLQGLVFLPSTSAHTRQENPISFTCQRDGRFYTPEPVPMLPDPREVHIAQPAPTTSESVTSNALPALQVDYTVPAQAPRETNHYPTWLQEVLGQKVDKSSTLPAIEEEQANYAANIFYAHTEQANGLAHTNENNWSQMAPIAQQQAMLSEPAGLPALTNQSGLLALPAPAAKQQSESVLEEDINGDDSSLFERIENVLIVITSILLLAVVLMIVLSIISAQVNTFFLHLLHIDIRTEIAYLLQLR